MKRTGMMCSAVVCALLLGEEKARGVMIMVKAMSTGMASAGPYMRGGMTLTTSERALRQAQAYVTRYDGPTQFTADYDIMLNPDNTVDSTRSKVKFTTSSFTDGGMAVASRFMTEPIMITGVTLMNNDPTMIASFTFSSNDWYPNTAAGAGGLMNESLSGMIDLKAGTSSYRASYASRTNGAIYTYDVMGMIMPPSPVPDPLPTEFGDPEIYAPPPIPEPTSLILLLAGTAGVALGRRRAGSR